MNTKFPKIEIKSRDDAVTEIYLDGHLLRGVRSYRLEQGVGNSLPILTVDLNALNVSVDSQSILCADGFGEIEIKFKEQETPEGVSPLLTV